MRALQAQLLQGSKSAKELTDLKSEYLKEQKANKELKVKMQEANTELQVKMQEANTELQVKIQEANKLRLQLAQSAAQSKCSCTIS